MPIDISRREDRPASGDLPELDGTGDILSSMSRFIRFGVTLIGVGVMLLGALLTASLFFQILEALREPEQFQQLVQKWGEVAGGDALSIPNPNGPAIPIAKLAGLGVLGGAALLLGYLAMGMLSCGARIVAWTTDDRKAVKDILDYAWQQRRNERGL